MLRCSIGGATVAVARVLRVLLSCANVGHDRVFPSIPEIAEQADLSETTVKVALRWLQGAGAVRVITDGDELHQGDGPHRAAERGIKRRGHHQVNTYEIRGLLRWLPTWILDRLFPGLAPSPAADLPLPASDPFADEQDSANAPGASAPQAAAAVSVGEAGKGDGPQRAETARKTRPAAAGAGGFLGRKIASVNKGAKSPTAAALVAAGVWPSRAVSMERRKGALWCRALLQYAAEEKPANVGGWLWAASRNAAWEWPERWERWIERERAAAARVVTAEGIAESAAPRPEVVAPAQSVAVSPPGSRRGLGALLGRIGGHRKKSAPDCKNEGEPPLDG